MFRRDLFIRSAGVGLLVAAIACFHTVAGGPATHGAGGGVAALEAAVGFLGTSLGAALLLLGRHVHDRVTVSARWAPLAPAARRPRPPAAGVPAVYPNREPA